MIFSSLCAFLADCETIFSVSFYFVCVWSVFLFRNLRFRSEHAKHLFSFRSLFRDFLSTLRVGNVVVAAEKVGREARMSSTLALAGAKLERSGPNGRIARLSSQQSDERIKNGKI